MNAFDEARYLAEMQDLPTRAVAALVAHAPALELYTVGIWTDPAAGVSAVSVDTAEPSRVKLAAADAWAAGRFATLPLHPAAELAVNSRFDWYDHPVPLRPSVT